MGVAAEAVPDAETVDSAPVWEETALSRTAVADGEEALVSAPSLDLEETYLTALSDGQPPMATEYAVRGTGETSGLLPVAMALVAERP